MANTNKRRGHCHSGSIDTARGLLDWMQNQVGRPARGHDANFDRILPTQMAKLLRDGLFEPDGHGSYRITELGRRRLEELT